jgi:F0F1-type ATP synthase membrane subunit c/vacuolar-type H+-ATPase subunit K
VVGLGVGDGVVVGLGVGDGVVVELGVGDGNCAIEAYSKDATNPTATSAVITKFRSIVIVLPEKEFENIVLNNFRGRFGRSHLLTNIGTVLEQDKN